MLANKLKLNINKSEFMLFKRRQRCLPNESVDISIDQTYLVRVDHIKFLGVILYEGLTWNHQVSAVTCKISKFVPILYSTRNNFDASSLKLIYHTIIYPKSIYCNTVWGNCCRKQLTSLELALKKKLCVSFYLEHSYHLFINLKLLNFKNVNKYMSLLLVFKSIRKDNTFFHSDPNNV